MRHLKSGRKLGVDSSHRVALLRSLTLALIEKDSIRTTPAKAKELRWFADRVVTLAKRGDVASRRHIIKLLGSTQNTEVGVNRVRLAIERVYSNLVPRFKNRNGGYTQMFRLAARRPGDNAELCIMQYIPAPEDKKDKGAKKDKAEKAPKKEAKTVEASPEAPKKEKKAASKAAPAEDKKPKAKKKDKED